MKRTCYMKYFSQTGESNQSSPADTEPSEVPPSSRSKRRLHHAAGAKASQNMSVSTAALFPLSAWSKAFRQSHRQMNLFMSSTTSVASASSASLLGYYLIGNGASLQMCRLLLFMRVMWVKCMYRFGERNAMREAVDAVHHPPPSLWRFCSHTCPDQFPHFLSSLLFQC